MAFLDIAPVTPGHTLVIPVRHVETLFDLPPAEVPALWATAQKVGRALQSAFSADGLNLLQANGAAAGQTIAHLHLHLVPRATDDRLGIHVPLGQPTQDRSILEQSATRIRQFLSSSIN